MCVACVVLFFRLVSEGIHPHDSLILFDLIFILFTFCVCGECALCERVFLIFFFFSLSLWVLCAIENFYLVKCVFFCSSLLHSILRRNDAKKKNDNDEDVLAKFHYFFYVM